MNPILFNKNETDFTTNGLGRLECISCKIVEERNGMYELEAEIPVNSRHASDIQQLSIIGAIPHDGGTLQAFCVYKITKPISGRFSVYARHISYRLTDIPCMPFSVASSPSACANTLAGLKTNAVESCPFTFTTDITTPAAYTQKTPDSIRKRLGGVEGSVIDLFGGEFEWDNWTVKLKKQRGRLANVTGITLRYGKNITDINQEEEIANTVTGVVPYWIDTDGNNLVTLPEKAVYSDHASSYPYHLTQVLDLSSNYQNQPTQAQLRATAQAYVRKTGFGVPKVSIKVSFVNLWETEEYKDIAPLERVQLCDEIYVKFEQLGVDAIAKVVKTKYDVLAERYDSIEVGSIRSTLAQAITDRDRDIDTIYLETMSKITQAAMNATAWLTSANGYVVAVRNEDGSWKELIFMDTNDPATALNGIRINNHGIGLWRKSIDGGNVLDGPYNNAWTIDGNLIADYITTGLLKSQNYVEPTVQSAPYAVSGLGLAMNSGVICSEYFALTSLGAFLKGTIEATGGRIGGAEITQNSLIVRGDVDLYTGDDVFIFRPTDYSFVEDFQLLLKTDSGTSRVEIVLYESGQTSETYTYNVTTEGVLTAMIDHTIGTNAEDRYIITVYGQPTHVIADDAILAFMGAGGFIGTLRGIFYGHASANGNFSGYLSGELNSPNGSINGFNYANGLFKNGSVAHKLDSNGLLLGKYSGSGDKSFYLTITAQSFTPENRDADDDFNAPVLKIHVRETNLGPKVDIYRNDVSGATSVLWENTLDNIINSVLIAGTGINIVPNPSQSGTHIISSYNLHYSADEHPTGKMWIDSERQTYQKTIKFTPLGTSVQVVHNISDFDMLVNATAVIHTATIDHVWTVVGANKEEDFKIDDTYIYWKDETGISTNNEVYVTLEYVKGTPVKTYYITGGMDSVMYQPVHMSIEKRDAQGNVLDTITLNFDTRTIPPYYVCSDFEFVSAGMVPSGDAYWKVLIKRDLRVGYTTYTAGQYCAGDYFWNEIVVV